MEIASFLKVISVLFLKGKLQPIRRLFRQMTELNVTPTLQSYAAVLECLGRQPVVSHDHVSHVLSDIANAVSG